MNEKIARRVRIAVKVLLCVSLVIAVGLALNYVRNLNPTADGFDVTNTIARMIHGDDYWSWENLTTGVYISASFFVVLFCVDATLELILRKNKW